MSEANDSHRDDPIPAGSDPTVRQSNEQIGSEIGPYRLLERLGEGAMGEVWRAEQREPVKRIVALKLIRKGMDTREVVTRFEIERQALALMDHPWIAKVHDAGETENGRPFIAMEYVPGEPIGDYCRRHRLTIEERLKLFQKVCLAVQHAHQKAVIHRDLKPRNILVVEVDGEPVPKVIDFGIAKATAQRLTDRSAATFVGQLIGTPLYMSPEQVEMSPAGVDTRADVYALGVVLYELLAGALPFDPERLAEAAYDEVIRLLREEEPPRPSTRVSTLGDRTAEVAAQRGVDARKLIGALRGDLDWITLKALEKDRRRRYESPRDMADDLDRYLKHEPIEARPPSLAYRSSRFVRRHRGPVALALVGLLALAGFAGWQTRQSAIIAAERDRAVANGLAARGQIELDRDPTAAAAYAVASLQSSEGEEAREVFRNAVWTAPLRRELPWIDALNPVSIAVARDGRSYATGWTRKGGIAIHDAGSLRPRVVRVEDGQLVSGLAFAGDDRWLVASAWSLSNSFSSWLEVRRVADGSVLFRQLVEGWAYLWSLDDDDRVIAILSDHSLQEKSATWFELSVSTGDLVELGPAGGGLNDFYRHRPAVDPRGRWVADAIGETIVLQAIEERSLGSAREVARHADEVLHLDFDARGERLASVDKKGILRIWAITEEGADLIREIDAGAPPMLFPRFDRWSSRIAGKFGERFRVWDLAASSDILPFTLVDPAPRTLDFGFLSDGSLLAGRVSWGVAHWATLSPGYREIPSIADLCLGGDAVVRVPEPGRFRVVPLTPDSRIDALEFEDPSVRDGMPWWRTDATGRHLIAGNNLGRSLTVTDLVTQERRTITSDDSMFLGALENRISPSGNRITGWRNERFGVGDLRTGEFVFLERDRSEDPRWLDDYEFPDDETLIELAGNRVISWSLDDGLATDLWTGPLVDGAILGHGRAVVTRDSDGMLHWVDPRSQERITLGPAPRGNILCADDHPGSRLVAVGGTWSGVYVHSLEDGRRWTLPLPESEGTWYVDFDPHGRWLVTSTSKICRVWDLPLAVPYDDAPREEIEAYLRRFTDASIAVDPSRASGYRVDQGRGDRIPVPSP